MTEVVDLEHERARRAIDQRLAEIRATGPRRAPPEPPHALARGAPSSGKNFGLSLGRTISHVGQVPCHFAPTYASAAAMIAAINVLKAPRISSLP